MHKLLIDQKHTCADNLNQQIIASAWIPILIPYNSCVFFSGLTGQEKVVEDKLKELNRAADMFSDRLGLTFKKTSGTSIY